MASAKPTGRRRAALAAAALAALLPLDAALPAGSPIPDLTPAAGGEAAPVAATRILRVRSVAAECGQNCPEWISVEGPIRPGGAAALANILAGLRGRRLPVLISSPGGSVPEALAMGRLIRANRLAVAVARTFVMNCPTPARSCPAEGRATADGAVCASACPLVLAGGVERLVGPAARVGVHQITTIEQERRDGDRPVRTVRLVEEDRVDRTVAGWFAAAGVGEPVMDRLRRTPPASLRWLGRDELEASRLATAALVAAAPIRTVGANGLDGVGFGGAGATILSAKVLDAGGLGAALTLTYRRGGGALELALAPPGGPDAPAAAWSLAAASAVLPAGDGAGRALLPRGVFCAPGGTVVATAAATKPLVFALGGTAVADLAAEACP